MTTADAQHPHDNARSASESPFRLDGKLALVTGARRGIGLALAGALADAGADVVAVARAFGDQEPIHSRIAAAGRRLWTYAADMNDRTAVDGLTDWLDREGLAVDILVNNAGIIDRSPAVEHPDATWDEVLEVDLTAPFRLTRNLGRQMISRGGGRIIFVGSVLSFQGGINVASYTAAKHGILGLTRALANEWAAHRVNVNVIAPGYIATDATGPLRNDATRNAALMDRIPAGRWGEPSDLGGAAVFLASDAAAYVHGSVLAVDGGWLGR